MFTQCTLDPECNWEDLYPEYENYDHFNDVKATNLVLMGPEFDPSIDVFTGYVIRTDSAYEDLIAFSQDEDCPDCNYPSIDFSEWTLVGYPMEISCLATNYLKMSRLRRRIAERLKEAQNTAAMLTTFNEVDMTEILAVRSEFKDLFEKRHGVRLGFMSFFVKAAIQGLKDVPAVNAQVDGEDIVYKNFYDIGVAVGTEQGLVVPVIRNAETLSLAGIEKAIGEYARKARDGKLALSDLSGGTFTISNGGVYGSLLSTPILNPPQSAILGMHKTQARPMVMPDGSIQARPMMYLALSYDHRIIDGSEAVTCLVRMKETLEDPRRMLLDM